MKKEVQDLIGLGDEANRFRYTAQWKGQGRGVVGLLCSYIPEEILHAAGLLPWRILGADSPATPRASLYRPHHTCLYCNHVLESLLRGDFEFLDAVVATSWDQDLVRLWDVWKFLGKNPPQYIVHLPLSDSDTHRKRFRSEVTKFFDFVQDLAGRRIGAEELYRSMALYDRVRALLHRVYGLRKEKQPPLSGSEILGLTTANLLMPKETFLEALEAILRELPAGRVGRALDGPRLLVSADRLEDLRFLRLVEETGCVVAMDDLDNGSRSFWNFTRPAPEDSLDQLLVKLADAYHSQPANPGMMTWKEQLDQIIAWVREFNVQGVLELPLMYSRSRQMRAPYFRKRLEAAGIPVASIEREYRLSSEGQLRTRIQAFVEMLE